MMDHNVCVILCILFASQSVTAFNVDPAAWKTFTSQSQNATFGYKIIQKDKSSLVVSDPLIQISQNQRGQIYNCDVTQGSCISVNVNVPQEAVNMSLGLSMTQDPQSSKQVFCGPTIPKKCITATTYNGMCFINDNSGFKSPIPSSLRDCPGQIDIAFLLDGSGSVGYWNFETIKTFVKNVIRRFTERDVQFAIAQYSHTCVIQYNFNQLTIQDGTWESKVAGIAYQYGWNTLTATAIQTVLDNLFTPAGGARASAKKFLVVVTDGQSYDGNKLDSVGSQADAKNIVRFAIGVGNAFDYYNAKEELNKIASDPDIDHVFKVTDFNALNNILQKLEENIIGIEGTQTSGDSSRMEFAQDGFSTAFTSTGSVLVSAVGAFQWKGGYQEYSPDGSFQTGSEHESYQGYSMAFATVSSTRFAILGAPRHQHKGQVTVSNLGTKENESQGSPMPQIGSYFGAEVCVVDLNSDSNTDLLLVSAPMYIEPDGEGKVFVYMRLSKLSFSGTVLVGLAGQRGRFGSSLASPADLDGDGFRDVLVGAPLEEDGQGSIYIFNGREGGIMLTYSQRIAGSSVRPNLRYFGTSLSQYSVDQTQDNFPDIAIGSMGAVMLLRSRPIMRLETKVTYRPSKIPTTDQTNCSQPLQNSMTVCFTMSGFNHRITDLKANISYNIMLDAKRQKYRGYFSPKIRILDDVMNIGYTETCKNYSFLLDACPEDALNPLSNQLTFTFEGLPVARWQNLRPILLPETKTTTDHNLDFEIDCGPDNVCVDELRMDFDFSGATIIEVGIMQELNVTVSVENRGENSYNTLFNLNYPTGLSYRRFTTKQGRVKCVSLDGETGVTKAGETVCQISEPILKDKSKVVFEITYSINVESTLGQNVTFSAVVKSGNDKHSNKSELSKEKTIDVKHAIYIAFIRHENSTIHVNFTAGKNDQFKPVKQIIKVENFLRELAFMVFIRVPVKLGDADIWDSSLQIDDCVGGKTEQPVITNFTDVIKKKRVVDCSVAECAVFSCDINLMRNERKLYNVTGNVSSGWIEQIGLRAAVFDLVSTTSMDYDKTKYIFYSPDSSNTEPSLQINTQVEVYEEPDLRKEIIGGAIGGLLLLALITAALYKAGFFKSQYQQMLEEAKGDGGHNKPQ